MTINHQNIPIEDRHRLAHQAVVDRLVRLHQEAAPVATGRLRDSIGAETRQEGDRIVTTILANTPYAAAVDARDGFFRQLADREAPGVAAQIEQEMQRG